MIFPGPNFTFTVLSGRFRLHSAAVNLKYEKLNHTKFTHYTLVINCLVLRIRQYSTISLRCLGLN